jgi:TolB protein
MKLWFGAVGSVLAVALLVGGQGRGLGATEIYLGISKSREQLVEIAVPDFIVGEGVDSGHTDTMAQVLRDDLSFSGIFYVTEHAGFVAERHAEDIQSGSIRFPEWALLGAQALVKARYFREKDNLVLEGKLYDVSRAAMITGKKYQGSEKLFRSMVHKLADEIVYRFTGERGVARTRISFAARTNGHKEIYVMDYDGQSLQQITNDRSIALSPAWSPDLRYLLYTSYMAHNPDLHILDLTTGKRGMLSGWPGVNMAAEWAPDGKRIALVLSKDGNAEIYTADRQGKNLRRLTNSRAIDCSPSWSPDGREVAFTSDRSGTPQLYIMNADGSRVRRLTHEGGLNDLAAWSPRGDRIAFVSRINGHFQVCTSNPDGTDRQQLTTSVGDNESPSWSPDGRHIVFSSTRSGSSQIYTMWANGVDQRRLTFLKGGCYTPTWAPRSPD